MAVNLAPPRAEDLLTIAGVRLGVAEAGVRKKNRKDLLVVEIAAESRVAGVFTRTRYCAPPCSSAATTSRANPASARSS